MSDLKAYRIDECGRMIEDSEPDEDSWSMWLSAQSEIAALREELADLHETNRLFSVAHEDSRQHVIKIEQRLADAERRNGDLEKDAARYQWIRRGGESLPNEYVKNALSAGRDCDADTYSPYFEVVQGEELDVAIDAALNPNPEAASYEN